MKIDLVYLHIARDPNFDEFSRRFAKTYVEFPAGVEHRLTIVNCNGPERDSLHEIFNPIATMDTRWLFYHGGGRDIGAHQEICQQLEGDFSVFCSSRVYFWKSNWLLRMAQAREEFGRGLYGAMASYENTPHIRTCFYGCDPKDFLAYPFSVTEADDSYRFESGFGCFTDFFRHLKLPIVMVTWDDYYLLPQWRDCVNGFRDGDQSQCLVFDRHTDLYRDADGDQKTRMRNMANGFHE